MKSIAILCLAIALQAQPPLAFEAASIKPSPPERPQFPYRFGPSFSMQARLWDLILQAYDIQRYQIAGGPEWIQSQWFQVQAKAAGEPDKDQIRLMLQTLLAERFQLKFHRETRTMSGFVLSVDKGGPKLPSARTDMPPDSKGVIQMGDGIWSRGSTIQNLAVGLNLELGQPVLDQTNIKGNYDFKLQFDDGPEMAAPGKSTSFGSVFTAIHEIGLKLDAQKVPIEVLVIDIAQKPSEN
jgi:uncharacterized protein (TIGR03435 family)